MDRTSILESPDRDRLWLAYRLASSQEAGILFILAYEGHLEWGSEFKSTLNLILEAPDRVADICLKYLNKIDPQCETTSDIRNAIALLKKDNVAFVEKVNKDRELLKEFHSDKREAKDYDDRMYAACAQAILLPVHMSACCGQWPITGEEYSNSKISAVKAIAGCMMRIKKSEEDFNAKTKLASRSIVVSALRDYENLSDDEYYEIYEDDKSTFEKVYDELKKFEKDKPVYMSLGAKMLDHHLENFMWLVGESLINHSPLVIPPDNHTTGADLGFSSIDQTMINIMTNLLVGFENKSLLKDILYELHKNPDKHIYEVFASCAGLDIELGLIKSDEMRSGPEV